MSIWKEFSDEEIKEEVERLVSSRLRLSPGLLRGALRELQRQSDNQFVHISYDESPEPPPPPPTPSLRYEDYEEMDRYVDTALGFYADDATGVSE